MSHRELRDAIARKQLELYAAEAELAQWSREVARVTAYSFQLREQRGLARFFGQRRLARTEGRLARAQSRELEARASVNRIQRDARQLQAALDGASEAVKSPPTKSPPPLTWVSRHPVLGRALRIVTLAGGTIAFISAIVTIVTGGPPWFKDNLAPMQGGGFKIAFADFAVVNAKGQVIQTSLGRDLAESIERTVKSRPISVNIDNSKLLDVRTKSPSTIIWPNISQMPVDRPQNIEDVARHYNADLVVTGTVTLADAATNVSFEFYISPDLVVGAEELAGYYQLPAYLALRDNLIRNPFSQDDVREAVANHTEGLTELIFGVGAYSEQNYEGSVRLLTDASTRLDGCRCRSVVEMLLGNAIGNLRDEYGNPRDLDGAERHYSLAEEIDPTYARARLGLAEVSFQRARADCEHGNIDEEGLRSAAMLFRSALDLGDQPVQADIPAKVAFGVARTDFCLSQALASDAQQRATESESEFRKVISEFAATRNERLRTLAGESHADLGLLYWPTKDQSQADAAYTRAAAEYLDAIDIVRGRIKLQARHAVYELQLAELYTRLEQYDQAEAACRELMNLDSKEALACTERIQTAREQAVPHGLQVVASPISSHQSSFQRRDVVPAGVPHQMSFGGFAGGSGDLCSMTKSAGIQANPNWPHYPDAGAKCVVDIGTKLWLDVSDFDAAIPLAARVKRPDGQVIAIAADALHDRDIVVSALPGDPLGEYTLFVDQGSIRTEGTYTVSTAANRHIELVDETALGSNRQLRLALSGFPSYAAVNLQVYRYTSAPTASSGTGTPTYAYITTLGPVPLDEQGNGLWNVWTTELDESEIYTVGVVSQDYLQADGVPIDPFVVIRSDRQ